MDKSWIDIKNRADPIYMRGIDSFLERAYNQTRVIKTIRCPCKRCRNTEFRLRNDVRAIYKRNDFGMVIRCGIYMEKF